MAEARVVTITDPRLSQLNAAHYRVLLNQSELEHARRNFIDAEAKAKVSQQKRAELCAEVGRELNIVLEGWNLETGVATFQEVPAPPPAPPADPPATNPVV